LVLIANNYKKLLFLTGAGIFKVVEDVAEGR
jgi:hypothetical protein